MPTVELREGLTGDGDLVGWTHVGLDGHFRFDAVPPGGYRLRFAMTLAKGETPARDTLAVANLAAGETRHLEVDVSGEAPGRVHGIAGLDGLPIAGGIVELHGPHFDRSTDIAADGSFDVPRLPPGPYRAVLRRKAGPSRNDALEAENPIDVRAGDTAEPSLEFLSRRLTLRILDAHGQPAPDRLVRIFRVDSLVYPDDQRTDQNGLAVFDPCTRGELEVRVSTNGEDWQELGTVQIPDSARQATFDLRLSPE